MLNKISKKKYQEINYVELNFNFFNLIDFKDEDSYYSSYSRCEDCELENDEKSNKETFNICIKYMLKQHNQPQCISKLMSYIEETSEYSKLTYTTIAKIFTFFVDCLIQKNPSVYKLCRLQP